MKGVWQDATMGGGALSLRWGSIVVGQVIRWSSGPTADWTAKCFLPGIRTTLGHDPDKNRARARVENAVAKWCALAGVEVEG